MYYSIFDLFKIGIGPSSSHTVGPINAGILFIDFINKNNSIKDIQSITVELKGSLAYTAYGHKTIDGIIIGLHGTKPENINVDTTEVLLEMVRSKHELIVNNNHKINFNIEKDIILNRSNHNESYNNVIIFNCQLIDDTLISKKYFSIGGGFIIEENSDIVNKKENYPFEFNSSADLLEICERENINIFDVVLKNEVFIENDSSILHDKIINIWKVMNNSIKSGISKSGNIDNILNVPRRANKLYMNLKRRNTYDPLEVMDWVNIFAIATCEENASGSKIVTAPTNGAAGIIPAVLKYYVKFTKNSNEHGIIKFLTTSTAIGILFKNNASISGAEVGCQGEVGVACSMAAAGLTASLGGTPKQIENAAEIGMEHNLGLTCDPIKGLVQIPCIERNSMGAIKAINASRLALSGSGDHKVSLDQVIKTMNDTGKSMSNIYKETALGGLAVNVIEC